MATKYEDLAHQALALLADIDVIERELRAKATQIVRGYAAYIEAPTEKVKFVPIDATGQTMGDAVPLSHEAPLELRPGGLWWVGMQIEYRHPQYPLMFMTEAIPLGFSALDKAAAAFKLLGADGREFEVRAEEDVQSVFDHIRLNTETRLRNFLVSGKRTIGFVK